MFHIRLYVVAKIKTGLFVTQQGGPQHRLHRPGGDKLDGVFHHRVHLRQVGEVGRRDDHLLHAVFVGSHGLFLQAADGQHPSPQGDFPGHCHVVAHRDAGKGGDKGGAGGDPR